MCWQSGPAHPASEASRSCAHFTVVSAPYLALSYALPGLVEIMCSLLHFAMIYSELPRVFTAEQVSPPFSQSQFRLTPPLPTDPHRANSLRDSSSTRTARSASDAYPRSGCCAFSHSALQHRHRFDYRQGSPTEDRKHPLWDSPEVPTGSHKKQRTLLFRELFLS
jgi:hypothetical protein